MPEPNPIQREWARFAEIVYPAAVAPVQLIECRRAFFAGAIALFGLLMEQLDPKQDKPTPADLALMDTISAEFKRYARDLKQGRG
jgi:hypothetical protein